MQYFDQHGLINSGLSNAGQYGVVENGRLIGPQGGVSGAQGMEGYASVKRQVSETHKRRVREAARMYADALQGRIDPWLLKQAMSPTEEFAVSEIARRYPGIYGDPGGRMLGMRETMSVTDYQALFVDVLDRQYYGFYSAYPIVNKGLARIHQLRDFRNVSRYLLDGMVSPLTAMDPAAPPPQTAMSGPVPQDGSTFPTKNTAPIQYSPLLYQAMASINWRAFVNDDLGIFKDVARRLGIQANRGISKFITGLYVDSAGPNANLYKSGYRNQIISANGASSNNPPLSSQGIMDALKILAGMRDSSGDPILITGKTRLWYGPAYTAVAENLMNATRVMIQNEGGTGNTQGFPTQFVETAMWFVRNMELVLDPYIPIVCTTSGIQETMWGITVDPDSVERPSIEVGFLSGYEDPVLYRKTPNTQRMGGGVDDMLGDFTTMNSDLKIVTVMGGTQIDGRTTVASTGAGS